MTAELDLEGRVQKSARPAEDWGGVSQPPSLAHRRAIKVWDPIVRISHWTIALVVLLNGFVTDPEETLHHYLGYTAATVLVIRLIWGLIGSRHARFTAFPPSPARALRHLADLRAGDRTVHLSHNPIGAFMVYNLWATIAVMAVTGYMMGTFTFFGVAWVSDLHGMAFNWLMFSLVLHLAGVVIETRRSSVPLVRAMITGRKLIPGDRPTE